MTAVTVTHIALDPILVRFSLRWKLFDAALCLSCVAGGATNLIPPQIDTFPLKGVSPSLSLSLSLSLLPRDGRSETGMHNFERFWVLSLLGLMSAGLGGSKHAREKRGYVV